MNLTKTIALCAALAACSGRGRSTDHTAKPAPSEIPTTALSMEARLITSAGLVEAKLGGDWQRVAPGVPLSGVRQLRALGSGALIQLGGGTRLWLRASSTVALAQDGDGALFLDVREGDARLALASGLPGYVKAERALVRASGRDVLVRRTAGAPVSIAFTAEVPARAEWSLAIEAEGLDEGFGRLSTAGAGGRTDLELRRVAVSVETDGGYALTSVEHIFHNASSSTLEGTFRFPVPAGAMVESLAMEINGKLMEGEIVEKEKARRTYENIVDNMLDPALLEWEHGNWFKLRVFPIEPDADKRVIIRYASPLRRAVSGYEYRFTAAAADMQEAIARFSMTVDGAEVVNVDNLDARREIAVPIADAQIPAVASEVRGDYRYTAVRVRPAWDGIAAPGRDGAAQKVMVLFDTSRSALEGRALALASLEAVLGELDATRGDQFALATVDIDVANRTDGFVPANAESIAGAMAAVKAVDMDGASNLAAAIELAAAARATSVVYIGDGTPTWGVTGDAALSALASDKLGSTPVFAALVGKGTSSTLWSSLTGRLGGRLELIKTPLAARRFAFFAARAPAIKRIANLTVAAPGAVIYPQQPTALYDGDELVVLMRDKASAPGGALEVKGVTASGPVSWQVKLASSKQAARVAQRWAAYHLPAREAAGADKAEIVELSREFGILSKHTSLLVLESEEAYREHQIERKRGPRATADNNQVQVTGGDLESLEARRSSLSPDHIQPGDPEIKIPAPADARRVTVIFPFGDTKIATWDADAEAWMVRFLIDKDTPDGDYFVHVVITHADGRVERQRLKYTVDTVAPELRVRVIDLGDGSYRIEARQRRPRGHRFGRDAHRVEVAMPDGQVVNLTQTGWGRFAREWTPATPVSGTIKVVVTATDRALNQSVRERDVEIRSR